MNFISIKKSSDGRHKIFNILGIKLSFYEINIKNIQKQYENIEKILAGERKIRKLNVTFAISMTSMFPAKPLLDYWLKTGEYNVKILILPDFRFENENVQKIQDKCYEELKTYYDKSILIKVPINKNDDNINYKEFTDIMFLSLPYNFSHEKYYIENICTSGILPAIVNYSFFMSKFGISLIKSKTYSMFWKIFVETKYNLLEYKKYAKLKDKNCVLTGYCKIDSYKYFEDKYSKISNKPKTIMIAPHHSIKNGYNEMLSLSNFYKYSDLFLQLPDIYPHINFIFRPHPALFLLLSQEDFWGEKKVQKYIAELKSKTNVEYSIGGNYFEDFVKSDGIINDCHSFLVEYFYTGKPQCYLLKNKKDINNKFTELGKKCLEKCYISYSKEDIINFIENVIVKENDTNKEERINFAKNEIMLNYPNSSEKISEYFSDIFQ